jgi:hypothetical protein
MNIRIYLIQIALKRLPGGFPRDGMEGCWFVRFKHSLH